MIAVSFRQCSHCRDKGMQMFLASCSQMRCHYPGSVSDLLFSAHLLNWVTDCGPDAKTHSNVHFVSIARCCLLQAWAYLVVTVRQRHLRMLWIRRLPGVRRLMLCPKDPRLKAG